MRGAVRLHPPRVILAYSRLFVPSRRAKRRSAPSRRRPCALLLFATPHTDPFRQHIRGCLCAEALILEVCWVAGKLSGPIPIRLPLVRLGAPAYQRRSTKHRIGLVRKLTMELPADVHRDLIAYSDVLQRSFTCPRPKSRLAPNASSTKDATAAVKQMRAKCSADSSTAPSACLDALRASCPNSDGLMTRKH